MMLNCLVFFILFYACSDPVVGVHRFNNNSWDFKDSLVVNFQVSDDGRARQLSFFFRNNLEYPYRNIFLFVELSYENQIILKDTVEYYITNPYGQWLGSGFGKNRDNYFLFKDQLILEKSGNYSLLVNHGMRNNPLVCSNQFGFKLK